MNNSIDMQKVNPSQHLLHQIDNFRQINAISKRAQVRIQVVVDILEN